MPFPDRVDGTAKACPRFCRIDSCMIQPSIAGHMHIVTCTLSPECNLVCPMSISLDCGQNWNDQRMQGVQANCRERLSKHYTSELSVMQRCNPMPSSFRRHWLLHSVWLRSASHLSSLLFDINLSSNTFEINSLFNFLANLLSRLRRVGAPRTDSLKVYKCLCLHTVPFSLIKQI